MQSNKCNQMSFWPALGFWYRLIPNLAALLFNFSVLIGQLHATPLTIVEVNAPAINSVFDLTGTVTVDDRVDHTLSSIGGSGDAFLQSRTFIGQPGAPAAGLYAYEYRIDMQNLMGTTYLPCIDSLKIEWGDLASLDYNGDGNPEDIFVLTSSGLGNIKPAFADKLGNLITFIFKPAVCATGTGPGTGDSSFFFGLVSKFPPQEKGAEVREVSSGNVLTLQVQAPSSTYTLTMTKMGEGDIVAKGIDEMVCGPDCTREYPVGTQILLTAVPAAGYQFSHWEGHCTETSPTVSVTMDTAKSCEAVFNFVGELTAMDGQDNSLSVMEVQGNTLSIPNGDTTPNLTDNTDFGSLNLGHSLTHPFTIHNIGRGTLTVTHISLSGAGCSSFSRTLPLVSTLGPHESTSFQVTFVSKSEDIFNCTVRIDSGEAPYTFNLTGRGYKISTDLPTSSVLPATFRLEISIEGEGEGSVSSPEGHIDCTKTQGPCQAIYYTGTPVKLTPIAAPGSYFSSWGGQEECAEGQVELWRSVRCVAYFHPLPELTVTKTGTGEGTVIGAGIHCGMDCTDRYLPHTQVTLTATPTTNSQFQSWGEECQGTSPTITLTMNTAKICQATFSPFPPPPFILPSVELSSASLKLSFHKQTKKLRFMAPQSNFSSLTSTGESVSTLHSKLSENLDSQEHVAIRQPPGLPTSASPEIAARHFLTEVGKDFGLEDSSALQLMKEEILPGERSVVRFQQVDRDIPVLGGEIIINMDAAKNVMSVSGEISPHLQGLDITPTLAAAEASQTALARVARDYHVEVSQLATNVPKLWIYDPAILGTPGPQMSALVWRIEVIPISEPLLIREVVLVEAHLGMVILSYSEIYGAKKRKIYDNQNTPYASLPGNALALSEGGSFPTNFADVDNAYDYSGDTYDFYQNKHGRDSIDGNGLPLISTVQHCPSAANCPWKNAQWNGSQMVYGDGYASADDVVGHELTHGVTEETSKLFYFYQSGAINESFSDMWGEFIDQTNGKGNDSDSVKWKMGEDLLATGALRDMANPPAFGDPDKMTSSLYYCNESSLSKQSGDGGGVHHNSGINNKAVYLMTDGDTFNGKTVTGLGIDKVAKLYYEVQTNLLTSAADYADLYDALLQACIDLQYSTTDCQQVKNALDAVEMNKQASPCLSSEAPICDRPNEVPIDIFLEDFELGSSQWTIGGNPNGNIAGFSPPLSAWFIPQTTSTIGLNKPYASSGIGNAWGFDQGKPFGGSSETFLAMKNMVSLPPNALMHFKHAYGLDSDSMGPVFYDGGVLEYTTNGSTWSDAGPLITSRGYNGVLSLVSDNPLRGKQAFVADSRGYISTRVNLSSLAGQNVRFRFRIGTDRDFYDYGWFIDDVQIYTCQLPIDACATAIPWNGQSDENAVVKNTGTLNLTGSAKPIKVKALCNYGTIQETTGNLLFIQVDPTIGFIYNEGSILGKDGKSSTDQSNTSTSLVNQGSQGSSIKLNAGLQLYNKGSIKAGTGGAGYLQGGNGGTVTIYANHIIQAGLISAGHGGEGNAHQPEWDGFWGNETNYGNQPVWGGEGGKTVLHATKSMSAMSSSTISSGTGGSAYVWCVNGTHLTDWEFDGRWYAGTCVSDTNIPVAIPTPGTGGDLIKLSPVLYDVSKASSGNGLYYEPSTLTLGLGTHLDAQENVVIFGGDDWVLDLRHLSQEAISTHGNITLAVGSNSTIDLRGNSGKVFKAGGQLTIFADTVLLEPGVSLENLVEAQGGIVTHPSKILPWVTLNGPGQVSGEPQTTLAIELELLNGGPEADVYHLSVTDSAGWQLAALPKTITVEGLDFAKLQLNMTLPHEMGATDKVTVIATSLTNPSVITKTDIKVFVNSSPQQIPSLSGTLPVINSSEETVTNSKVANDHSYQTIIEDTPPQEAPSATQTGDETGEAHHGTPQQLDAPIGNQNNTLEGPKGTNDISFPEMLMGGEIPLESSFPMAVVQVPTCPTEGLIDWSCNAQGQTISHLTLGQWGSISNGYLVGTIDNQGWVSNLTLDSQSFLKGGWVTGYILNQGTMTDITFVGAMLQGGTLAGFILNASQVGGTLLDVTFAPHAHLEGGKLQGEIRGDKEAPALLEHVKILKGTQLSGVTLGEGVILEEGGTLE